MEARGADEGLAALLLCTALPGSVFRSAKRKAVWCSVKFAAVARDPIKLRVESLHACAVAGPPSATNSPRST